MIQHTVTPSMRALRHSLFEDVQALLAGTLLVSLGVVMFAHARLVSGGIAGVAFLLHYITGFGFGPLFFLANLPFYWLAWRKLGPAFVLKTFSAVVLLSLFAELLPRVLDIARIDPLYAALAGGVLMGVGLLILFRHRASLGGLNIMVLWLQERFGWRAGVVQMAIDGLILLASSHWLPWQSVALSMLGALALNLTLALNHRPGRYVAP